MTIELKRDDFPALKIRKKIGVRKLGTIRSDGSSDGSGNGGSIGSGITRLITGTLGALKGVLVGAAGIIMRAFEFSFTTAWALFVDTAVFLYNFNWNITDEEIDQGIKSQWLSFASLLGGAAGESLGFFTCGVLPTASLFAFNPAMAAYVLRETQDEFIDELAGQLAGIIMATARSTAVTGFYLAYKNIRKAARDPNNPIGRLIPGLGRLGQKGSPVLSLAKTVDDKVESIKNPFVRTFVESFLEEYWEGCVEAGFIVAGAMDSWVWQQKTAQKAAQAEVVEIVPNRLAEKEAIVLSGTKQELKPMITGILATHQILQNRDVGQWVGEPIEYDFRAGVSDITVHLHYVNKKEPPFYGKNIRKAVVRISDCKRSQLNYETILRLADPTGYQWGRFMATGKLSNNRKIVVSGASPEIAKSRVYDLLPLQSAELLVINIVEHTKEAKRKVNTDLQREATQIYPEKAVIVVQNETATGKGKAHNDGKNRALKTYSFPLWTGIEPADYKESIRDLFSNK